MASSTSPRKARASGRARAALAWALVLFACAQGGFRLAIRRHPILVDREFGLKLAALRGRLAEGRGRPLVVMLGSSRVATGFRPDALSRPEGEAGRAPIAFNFAQVGSGPEMAHLSLHRLLASGIRPDWVFIEYWPPFWGVERYMKEYLSQINIGCLDWGGIRLLGGYVRRPDRLYRQWLTTQIVPLYASRQELLSRYAPSWSTDPRPPDHRCQHLDPWGWWSPRLGVDEAEYRKLVDQTRAIYVRRLEGLRTDPQPDRALRQILALCRREHIAVAVVLLPEGTEFRSWYPPEALAEVEGYLDRLTRDDGVPVIDARAWVADDGFMDSHHLLPRGAEVFSRRLGRDVVRPLLAGEPLPPRHVLAEADEGDVDESARLASDRPGEAADRGLSR